jgi:hypothetical protein
MLTSLKLQIKATPALAVSCSDERAVARAQAKDKGVDVALSKPAPQKATATK